MNNKASWCGPQPLVGGVCMKGEVSWSGTGTNGFVNMNWGLFRPVGREANKLAAGVVYDGPH